MSIFLLLVPVGALGVPPSAFCGLVGFLSLLVVCALSLFGCARFRPLSVGCVVVVSSLVVRVGSFFLELGRFVFTLALLVVGGVGAGALVVLGMMSLGLVFLAFDFVLAFVGLPPLCWGSELAAGEACWIVAAVGR